MSRRLPGPLRGIVPPLVTPLSGPDQLDEAGLDCVIEHVLAGGVHGLFILGTTGEAPSLSQRLRREVVERTCRTVRGRVPVLVGITDSSLVESVALAKVAAECGADAVVTAPPFYFHAGQPELIEYVECLVGQLPLPLMLYNMPSLAKVVFEAPTVATLMQSPDIIGIKDSSGDMGYVHHMIDLARSRADWTVLVGPEMLLAETVLLGGHGGINGGANLFPRLFVDLYEAAVANDLPRVRDLHDQVRQLGQSVYSVGRHASSYLKGLKCALSLSGICSDMLAPPFSPFRAPERAMVQKYLDSLKDYAPMFS